MSSLQGSTPTRMPCTQHGSHGCARISLKAQELWVEKGFARFGQAIRPEFIPSDLEDALVVRRRSFVGVERMTAPCSGRLVTTPRRSDARPRAPRVTGGKRGQEWYIVSPPTVLSLLCFSRPTSRRVGASGVEKASSCDEPKSRGPP